MSNINTPKKPLCIAFDCFGTVFDMSNVDREQIRDYVRHVRKNDFSRFGFPRAWWELKPHPDAAEGVRLLQSAGFVCCTLSNGDARLLRLVSESGGIDWDHIVDLEFHRVYKPHVDAYRTVETDLGFKPDQTLMVTANPTFGDLEGAAAVGMPSAVVRQPSGFADILVLARHLTA